MCVWAALWAAALVVVDKNIEEVGFNFRVGQRAAAGWLQHTPAMKLAKYKSLPSQPAPIPGPNFGPTAA